MSPDTDRVLGDLGAEPGPPGRAADLVPELVDPLDPEEFGAGLPAGTLEYATGVALALGALAERAVSGVAVGAQMRLPEVMATWYRSTFEMRPAPPMPIPGGGWVHADLGAPGTRDDFERLKLSLPRSADAVAVAAAAQEWRLPVCDYKPRSGAAVIPPLTFDAGPSTSSTNPIRVLDLTNMWAGPLATWLLQDLGAHVTKVEPAFRPDGFRATDGNGIHPDGHSLQPGRDSAMWNALNDGKAVVDLDLRSGPDRDRFLELARTSDVVIDSFSPRVWPNFALDLPAGATRCAFGAGLPAGAATGLGGVRHRRARLFRAGRHRSRSLLRPFGQLSRSAGRLHRRPRCPGRADCPPAGIGRGASGVPTLGRHRPTRLAAARPGRAQRELPGDGKAAGRTLPRPGPGRGPPGREARPGPPPHHLPLETECVLVFRGI